MSTDNTFKDEGCVQDTADSRDLNKVSLCIPCCDGKSHLDMTYSTPNINLVAGVFNLITSDMGVKVNIATAKKGGDGT